MATFAAEARGGYAPVGGLKAFRACGTLLGESGTNQSGTEACGTPSGGRVACGGVIGKCGSQGPILMTADSLWR